MLQAAKILVLAVLLLAALQEIRGQQQAINSSKASGSATNLVLPQIPKVKPPVDYFRELLAMSPSQRRRSLSDRPAESQERLMAKLQEYESLSPDERELRLQATELRWYLSRLMAVAPSNRVDTLADMPAEKRALVEARLEAWDKLPAAARQALLDNQFTLAYFSEIKGASGADQERALKAMSPQSRERLEAGLTRWHNLPEPDRQQLLQRFGQFFELTPVEKKKALATLSEPEQRQIERTLKTFYAMSPSQRAKCIRGFNEFALMSSTERKQFLNNAERWKSMTPEQRQAWRELVAKLNLPPMPGDFAPPPMPPQRGTAIRQPPALTNVPLPDRSSVPGS